MHPAHRHTQTDLTVTNTPSDVDTKSDWGTHRYAKMQILRDEHAIRHRLIEMTYPQKANPR